MKSSKIFISGANSNLSLSSGKKAIAVYPCGKGEKKSFLLMEDQELLWLKKQSI